MRRLSARIAPLGKWRQPATRGRILTPVGRSEAENQNREGKSYFDNVRFAATGEFYDIPTRASAQAAA